MPQARSVILIVGTGCPPEREEQFNQWYNEKLVPSVRDFPGLEDVTRYKLKTVVRGEGDYAQYIAVYQFKDQKAFDAWFASPQVAAAVKEFMGMVGRGEAVLNHQLVYETLRNWPS